MKKEIRASYAILKLTAFMQISNYTEFCLFRSRSCAVSHVMLSLSWNCTNNFRELINICVYMTKNVLIIRKMR